MQLNLFRTILKANGLTQNDMAEVVGITPTTFSSRVKYNTLTAADIQLIGEYLNITPEDMGKIFFSDEENLVVNGIKAKVTRGRRNYHGDHSNELVDIFTANRERYARSVGLDEHPTTSEPAPVRENPFDYID